MFLPLEPTEQNINIGLESIKKLYLLIFFFLQIPVALDTKIFYFISKSVFILFEIILLTGVNKFHSRCNIYVAIVLFM